MRRWIGLGLLVLFAYVVALVVTLPAERALEWGTGAAQKSGVRLAATGVSGTLWRGTAAHANLNNIDLGRTEWSLSPWSLLLGRVAIHFRVEPSGGWVEGDARVTSTGLVVSDTEGNLSAAQLLALFSRGPAMVGIDGSVALQVSELVRNNGKIESAKATLVWRQAALVKPAAVRLGDLKVEFTPGVNGAISGNLSDGGGPLSLGGNITLNPDSSYRLNVTLGARPGADQALTNSLPLIGRPDGKGGYNLVWAGRL